MPETNVPNATEAHRWLGALALAATIVARGFATALPGSAAGIERWIETTRMAGAILSQATVVFGAAAAVGLLIATLWRRGLPYAYRILAFPTTAVVLTLVAMSARFSLHPIETRILGVAVFLLAIAAAAWALSSVRSRAAALVLLTQTLAGAAHLGAHAVATATAPRSPDTWSTPLASMGMALDALSLSLATAWLLGQRRRGWPALVVVAALIAGLVAWGAASGSADGAPLWQVLASKALSEMAPSPAPGVSVALSHWLDAYAIAVSTLLLLSPRWQGALPTAMCLALLGRASPDVPLCALMLALSALLTAFGPTLSAGHAATRRSGARGEPHRDRELSTAT